MRAAHVCPTHVEAGVDDARVVIFILVFQGAINVMRNPALVSRRTVLLCRSYNMSSRNSPSRSLTRKMPLPSRLEATTKVAGAGLLVPGSNLLR